MQEVKGEHKTTEDTPQESISAPQVGRTGLTRKEGEGLVQGVGVTSGGAV